MKVRKSFMSIALATSLVGFGIAGCGSSSDSTTTPTVTTKSGSGAVSVGDLATIDLTSSNLMSFEITQGIYAGTDVDDMQMTPIATSSMFYANTNADTLLMKFSDDFLIAYIDSQHLERADGTTNTRDEIIISKLGNELANPNGAYNWVTIMDDGTNSNNYEAYYGDMELSAFTDSNDTTGVGSVNVYATNAGDLNFTMDVVRSSTNNYTYESTVTTKSWGAISAGSDINVITGGNGMIMDFKQNSDLPTGFGFGVKAQAFDPADVTDGQKFYIVCTEGFYGEGTVSKSGSAVSDITYTIDFLGANGSFTETGQFLSSGNATCAGDTMPNSGTGWVCVDAEGEDQNRDGAEDSAILFDVDNQIFATTTGCFGGW